MPVFHGFLRLLRVVAFEDVAGATSAAMLGALALSALDSARDVC